MPTLRGAGDGFGRGGAAGVGAGTAARGLLELPPAEALPALAPERERMRVWMQVPGRLRGR
ncbi:hypothetical protein ACFS32_16955 [Novosphingobium pokkalii]|uniref:hypothetical protein n=1 Tax=Novosphingobium pokkalii TaxID=1770194 RepID=UPI003625C144